MNFSILRISLYYSCVLGIKKSFNSVLDGETSIKHLFLKIKDSHCHQIHMLLHMHVIFGLFKVLMISLLPSASAFNF